MDSGLKEAIAHARGELELPAREYEVPGPVNVRAIRARSGLSQSELRESTASASGRCRNERRGEPSPRRRARIDNGDRPDSQNCSCSTSRQDSGLIRLLSPSRFFVPRTRAASPAALFAKATASSSSFTQDGRRERSTCATIRTGRGSDSVERKTDASGEQMKMEGSCRRGCVEAPLSPGADRGAGGRWRQQFLLLARRGHRECRDRLGHPVNTGALRARRSPHVERAVGFERESPAAASPHTHNSRQ
jgi:hypothetical protein